MLPRQGAGPVLCSVIAGEGQGRLSFPQGWLTCNCLPHPVQSGSVLLGPLSQVLVAACERQGQLSSGLPPAASGEGQAGRGYFSLIMPLHKK